jgi:4-hydroxy-3-methylbut-2-en-1-yl diphosphate reductase
MSTTVPNTRPAGSGLMVLTPLRVEARALSSRLPTGSVVRTGAGSRRAADALSRLDGRGHAAVAVAGVGGGLVPGQRIGALVVADRVLDSHGSTVAELPSAAILSTELRAAGIDVETGAVISADRIVRGRSARSALAAHGAVAVDLESSTLSAYPWKSPVAVLRALSDTFEHDLRSPALVANGMKALATLRSAAPVIDAWAAAVRPRKVILASPRSFCAGVDRAIETVRRALSIHGAPVFVRRQIVHNRHVVEELESHGAVFVQELDEIPDGAVVVFSAHGVSTAVRSEAHRRELQVVDATCPLVSKVHREVHRFKDRGYQVVLIGHAGHDEIEGTLGESDDVVLLETPDDVDRLKVADPSRVAYLTQTTLSPADVEGMVSRLSARFPELVSPHADDICYATHNRQDALKAMASDCDLVIVVGSSNSSNAARLVEVAQRCGTEARLVEDESELRLNWLANTHTVGVTAAASTPPSLVERVVTALSGIGPLGTTERAARTEHVSFPLPLEVR